MNLTGMKALARLEKTDLRNIWVSEPKHFTSWLAQKENLDLLAEAIGIELEFGARERSVGPFRIDLFCKETENGRHVVIENQIEGTNHTHLGQALTYAAGIDAAFVVWIAKKFTTEHRAALAWLNRKANGNARFFGIEIELWQIGRSRPAPRFNVVSEPDGWSNRFKKASRTGILSEGKQFRLNYWAGLTTHLKSSKSNFDVKEPRPETYLRVQSPYPGFHCGFEFCSAGEKYIGVYFGTRDPAKIRSLARIKQRKKADFERGITDEVFWSEKKQGGWFWVALYRPDDPTDVKGWPSQHEWMTQNLAKLIGRAAKYLDDASSVRT